MTETESVSSARSWGLWRKVLTVFFVASFSFFGTFAASIFAPGRVKIQEELGLSRTVSVLPFSLFNLGLAWGCIVSSPMSEQYGRSTVYYVAMPALLVLVMATGFCKDLASLLVVRFIGGLAGSPGITLASSTISDMYAPGRARGVALFSYYSMPWLGSVLGPLIGSIVVASKPWPWTQWVFLFIATPVVFAGLLFLRETKYSVLKAKSEHDTPTLKQLGPQNLRITIGRAVKSIPEFMRSSLLRPLKMLFTEMIVGLVCIYAGFNFGLIYALIVVIPVIFQGTYGFDTVQQGLAFLGLIAGCIIGPACLIAENEVVVRRATPPADAGTLPTGGPPPPETKLHGAMFGSVLLPAGLLWFAWTARSGISYLSPIFASALITMGALTIYVSSSAYVIDTYGPKYGASANGATSIARYTMAAAVPLFILPMYDGLGTAWATSVLALCAVLMTPIPFCFFRWGPSIRQRCKFQTER